MIRPRQIALQEAVLSALFRARRRSATEGALLHDRGTSVTTEKGPGTSHKDLQNRQ